MRSDDFMSWLKRTGRSSSSRLSELRRIESAHGDLDAHYESDRMETLIASLNYSSEDKRLAKPNPAKFCIEGDYYNNLNTYQTALRRYRDFRDSTAAGN